MAVNDQFMPPRKAYSAENPKEITESASPDSSINEILNKTYKISSASYLSARQRRHAQKNLDCSPREDFNPKYLKVHNKENQKLFLQSSQILEKLNKISTKTELYSQSNLSQRKVNLKKVILYHDKLKKLLVERSSIILLEECELCIKRTTKLVVDFRYLYANEKLKMTTMPTQAFNRFISSTDINVPALELLIRKLKSICDLNTSLNCNYQNIINLFHITTDIELNERILKINGVLKNLMTDVFYWSLKCIKLFIQKLCLADPNSISPDFLQSILKVMHVYNDLISKNKTPVVKFLKNCYIFYDFLIHSDSNIVSFGEILQYLSFFEAKVAAERIVNFLTCSCKKYKQTDLKRKSVSDREIQKSDTSDYSSINISENDTEQDYLKISLASLTSFINILLAIVQRNQSLILKYMYAITSLESMLYLKDKGRIGSASSSGRQMWDLPQLYNTDENYAVLEECYWANFWNSTKTLILKLLFDVPYHQYGDSAAGNIIFWPDSFLQILTESFKRSAENKELSFEGRNTMTQIYFHLVTCQANLSWDKEFTSTLPIIQSHLCPPVPIFQNQINSLPGNSLNKSLEVLLVCSSEIFQMEFFLHMPVLLHLQATLDAYILWINNKSQTFIASQNLPTYLLISCSDCCDAVQLLKDKPVSSFTEFNSSISLKRLHSSQTCLHKTILKQIEFLSGYTFESSIIIHNICFSAVNEILRFLLKNHRTWKMCVVDKFENLVFESISDILRPMTEVLKQLNNFYPIMLSITTSVSKAFLCVLSSTKRSLNVKNIQKLNTEYSKFQHWLDSLNMAEQEMEKLKHSYHFEKLTCILQFIQDFINKPKTCLKRRNRIVPQMQLEMFPVENKLSTEEKAFWERKCSKTIFCSCS